MQELPYWLVSVNGLFGSHGYNKTQAVKEFYPHGKLRNVRWTALRLSTW